MYLRGMMGAIAAAAMLGAGMPAVASVENRKRRDDPDPEQPLLLDEPKTVGHMYGGSRTGGSRAERCPSRVYPQTTTRDKVDYIIEPEPLSKRAKRRQRGRR